MTESTQSNASDENNIFIKNLLEVTRKDDDELKKFIDHHLFPERSQLSIDAINKNVNILKGMNCTQQALVKGRARHFEETNDPSKYFPTLFASFALVISLYALLREITKNSWLTVIMNILVISLLTVYTVRMYVKVVKRRSTAVFFNALISSINSTCKADDTGTATNKLKADDTLKVK